MKQERNGSDFSVFLKKVRTLFKKVQINCIGKVRKAMEKRLSDCRGW